MVPAVLTYIRVGLLTASPRPTTDWPLSARPADHPLPCQLNERPPMVIVTHKRQLRYPQKLRPVSSLPHQMNERLLTGDCRPKAASLLTICGRPFGCKRLIEGLTRNRMLPSVRPVMRPSRWPVWEFADRNHITNSVLMARWKALVLPAPSRRLLCHTLLRPTAPSDASGPPRLMPRLRPELCNPLASPAMPTRCAPSCWRGRP